MAEQVGEKTEQATPKRLEEALQKGQFARSPEVQTVFILCGAILALRLAGGDAWERLGIVFTGIYQNLHKISLEPQSLQGYAIQGALLVGICVGPLIIATVLGGLLAGGIQSRFNTASEVLTPDWDRVNPAKGFKRVFSVRSLVPTGLSILKLAIIGGVCWSLLRKILLDPIFFTALPPAEIARFLASTSFGLSVRVILVLMLVAGLDYAYQFWRTNRDMMMTKQEVKDELKSTEGDPHMKARQRRRRKTKTQRQMLQEVPKADVVVTNPTHLAIALRYDRKTMKAPRIIAKGSRLNALRIREIATAHQVPIIENKPLARMMFKHGRVGGEVPAELYAAVAEVLACVYRMNRFRYYTEQTQN